MAFTLPNFNISCLIGSTLLPYSFPFTGLYSNDGRVFSACNLAFGRRINTSSAPGTPTQVYQSMFLLLPPLTDVRGPQGFGALQDAVEVPLGSFRFYGVVAVDDIGKGFANEHRCATIVAWPGSWAPPYP